MRAGPQLGVAKAARAPPCTLPILGRRFILTTNYKASAFSFFSQLTKLQINIF